MSQRTRLIIAVAVLVGGFVVLMKGYLGSRPPSAPREEPQVVTETVEAALDVSQFDVVPTTETIHEILEGVRSEVIRQAQGIDQVRLLGPVGVRDIADAFVERLQLITIPDFERDFSAAAARGDPRGREESLDLFQIRMKSYDPDALPGMAPSRIEVSRIVLTPDGNEVASHRSRMALGFGVTTGHREKNKLPVPDDPVQQGMLAVEVTMPMMRKDAMTGKLTPAIIGYQFAWNRSMQRWIPYQSVVFKDPNHVFSAPPI